jgi:MoaA/NifB/PqqE/SkfB family radical SAM enzyme
MKKIYMLFYLIFLEIKRTIFGIKYFSEVDVTDNCNLKCRHCYHFHGKTEFETKELPLSVWEKRFSELHKSGIRFILLVGGEPALRKDVLMLADSIFPYVAVITNGTIKIPKEFNNTIFVSMDGSQETNDSIRGDGVFSRVIRNYSGDKRVVINMTIMKNNYKELEDVVRISKENGFGGLVCNICADGTDVNLHSVVRGKGRTTIIKELERVKTIYPKDFLLSKAMIKWYKYPDHKNRCYWGDEVLHFDVSWNRRRCFGNNADCSNCGCLAGSIQNPLRLLRNARLMAKFI